jgi:PhnB protein
MTDTPDQRYRPDDRIMQGVIPYLCLPGQCGAAADFYIRAFAARDIGRMEMTASPASSCTCNWKSTAAR